MDAGASIGDTTAWFLSKFLSATVIALEPDSENYALLRKNCELLWFPRSPTGCRSLAHVGQTGAFADRSLPMLISVRDAPESARLYVRGSFGPCSIEARQSRYH